MSNDIRAEDRKHHRNDRNQVSLDEMNSRLLWAKETTRFNVVALKQNLLNIRVFIL